MPFTIEQFLGVFEKYNLAVWPTQVFMVLLAAVAIFLAVKKTAYSNKIISLVLTFFWLWMGIAYHITFFAAINKAAYIFGVLYILQGLIFLYAGVIRSRLSFEFASNFYGVMGTLFIIYALAIYPTIGHAYGHVYPKNPTFVLPCPTTIFTFGILIWAQKPFPKYVLVIPLLWSIIGFAAAISLGMFEDIGLLVAGILGTGMIWYHNRAEKVEVIG